MAKRSLSRSGWVELTGLRFAKKFATREEIIRAAREFFGRRGLNFGELKVEFHRTRKPRIRGVMGIPSGTLATGDTIGFLRLWVRVYVERAQSSSEFFRIIFHELDHIAWDLEGKLFDNSLSYRERSHEIRAREGEWEELKRFYGLVWE